MYSRQVSNIQIFNRINKNLANAAPNCPKQYLLAEPAYLLQIQF